MSAFSVQLSGGRQKEEEDLLERLRAKRPEALAEAYDLYGRSVFSIILRIVRDNALAEDLTQDVFLRVWNCASSLDREYGAIGPWVLRIARHRALDSFKARSRSRVCHLDWDPIATNRAIENDMIHSERTERITRAYRDLPADQKRVLDLAYFEGLSQQEIATSLGQPLGTIKSRTRAGLRRLRETMELGNLTPIRHRP